MSRIQFFTTLLIVLPAIGCASGMFPQRDSEVDDDFPEISIEENLSTPGSFRKSFSSDKATGLDPKSREIEHSLGFK